MPGSRARKRKKRASNEQKLTTPSDFRGSCSGGEDDEYVDKDNPLKVPSNSIHTGAPPSSKSVVCPDDVESLLLLIEKWESSFAPSLPFDSTVSSDAAPVDELDCSTQSAPDCDDDDDSFIDEFESYLESMSPVLTPATPDQNLRNNFTRGRSNG